MNIKVAVVGATGYAGAELVRILSGHPEVELTVLTSRQFAGTPYAAIYPALSGQVDKVCQPMDVDMICDSAEVVFMALPHRIPMAHVPDLLDRGKKVIDLSADFRFRDPAVYEASYQPHSAKSFLPEAVYGLSEVFTDRIRTARLIGNPGCYPTSILLPLLPLISGGLIEAEDLTADAKSGVSGAGRSPSQATHFCEVHESFKAYKIAAHRHNPEIDEKLSLAADSPVHITFVPHLVPMSRGMLTTIYAKPKPGVLLDDVRARLVDYYRGRSFVRICHGDRMPETRHVRGTNFCDIGAVMDMIGHRLIVIAAIDNLVKGAAGQAVQNLNIMFGLDEGTGLLHVPYPL